MLITKAARRYASALLQLAVERDEVKSVLEDIELIKNTIDGSRELILFLRSPIIKYDDKVAVLNELFAERVQEMTRMFIGLLARKNRVHLLDQIVQAFIEQYNKYAGIIKVDVYTARALNESQKKALHKALEEKTNKKVNMHINLNESLKGGLAVRIDDTVIDGTVKHKLEQLEEMFLNTALE